MVHIWFKNKKYYFYSKYSNWRDAYNTARYFKRRDGSQYLIHKKEVGFVVPRTTYLLYLTKVGTY